MPLMTLTVILNGLYVFHPNSDFMPVTLRGTGALYMYQLFTGAYSPERFVYLLFEDQIISRPICNIYKHVHFLPILAPHPG